MRKIDAPLAQAMTVAEPVSDLPTAPMPFAEVGRQPGAAPAPTSGSRLVLHRVASPAEPVFADLCRLVSADRAYWARSLTTPMNEKAAAEVLRFLPPNTRPEHKYLWALAHDGRLVGCLDVIREWPLRNTLSIGLLMVAPAFRGQGFGQAALEQLRARTRAWNGVRRWRVAVVETQAEARRFWRSKAFSDTGQRQPHGAHSAPLMVMERNA